MSQANEAQLIESIRNGKFSERELINLYKNAKTKSATAVMETVKIKMRVDFPRAANRMFGAKESEANALLEDVFQKRLFRISRGTVYMLYLTAAVNHNILWF